MGRYQKSAIKMASFWVDTISEGRKGSAGGDGTLDMMLILLKHDTPRPSDDDLLELQMRLETMFERELDKRGGAFHVSVDYAPDCILTSACKACNIDYRILPIKSSVYCVKNGKVYGKIGYAGVHHML